MPRACLEAAKEELALGLEIICFQYIFILKNQYFCPKYDFKSIFLRKTVKICQNIGRIKVSLDPLDSKADIKLQKICQKLTLHP